MTPVQLPEVPAHSANYHVANFRNAPEMRNTELCELIDFPQGSHSLYTAAQLREYATEACRPLLDALEEIANYPELDALELKRIARALLTPSETNSER